MHARIEQKLGTAELLFQCAHSTLNTHTIASPVKTDYLNCMLLNIMKEQKAVLNIE